MIEKGTEAEGRRHKVRIQNAKFLHSSFCTFHSTFSSAFSLIELIVVMMVVGILTTVVIIKFTGVDSQSNRLAANELRANLTYIRNMAMNRERTTWVQFNKAANNYTVRIDATGTGAFETAKDPVTQKNWIVDISDRFPGVALSAVDIGVSGGTNLYFSGTNGMPYSAGGALTTNGTVVFKSGLTVTVARVTGYASLE